MTMKECLVCNATAPASAHTCAQCGCQDWRTLVSPPAPLSAPVSLTPSRRDRRNEK